MQNITLGEIEMIYYRHKKTAEIVSEAEFEDKYIVPKAEEYFTYDDILMDFMNKSPLSTSLPL